MYKRYLKEINSIEGFPRFFLESEAHSESDLPENKHQSLDHTVNAASVFDIAESPEILTPH